MKLKCDYVTNSSSTSFVAYGKFLENAENLNFPSDILKVLQHYDEEQEVIDENFEEECDFGDGDVNVPAVRKKGSIVLFFTPPQSTFCGEYSGFYIGVPADEMGEDETPRQFKKRVSEEIQKLGIQIDAKEIKLMKEGFGQG